MQVLASIPYNTQQDVVLNTFIKLDFDEPVNEFFFKNDLDIGNFFQLYEQPIAVKIGVIGGIVSGEPNTIYIIPLVELKPNTEYVIAVIGGENGISNSTMDITLGENFVLRFKTGINRDTSGTILTASGGIVTSTQTNPNIPYLEDLVEPIQYEDLKNLPESEAGIDNLVYDFTGDDSSNQNGLLYVDYSSPDNLSYNNPNVDLVKTYWNRDILDNRMQTVFVTKNSLPFNLDPFANNQVPILDREIIPSSEFDILLNNSGVLDTTNLEFMVVIPPGAFVAKDDTKIRNEKTVIRFTGILVPMFATVDVVLAIIGKSIEPDNMEKFEYDLYKKIHQISYELVNLLGYTFNPGDPRLYWASRYVACRAAFELLNGPFAFKKTVSSRSVLGQSISYHVFSNKDNTRNPLDDCMNLALAMLGLTATGATIGLKSADTAYYPGRKKENSDRGFHGDTTWSKGTPVDNITQILPNTSRDSYER